MKPAAIILGLVLLLVAAAELHQPGFFLLDDIQSHYLPGLDEIARAWLQGEVPLISSYTWCAGGLAGEYQYGTFNPLIQLAAVVISFVPSLATRAAMMVVFFGWITGWGAYLLGRELKMTAPVALALAAIFCLNRYALDSGWRAWLPIAIGFSWFPWFWLSLVRERLSIPLLVASLCLILTAGSPFLVVASAFLGLFYFASAMHRREWGRAAWLAAGALSALAICSGPILLLAEYSQSALRSQRPNWMYRLEPWHALSYFLPGFSFHSLSTNNLSLYTCIGWIPCLGILGIWLERRSLSSLWWLAALWLGLGLAPSVGGMRFSSRWLYYLNPLLGLLGLQWLDQKCQDPEHRFGKASWAAILLGQALGLALDLGRQQPHQWLAGPLILLGLFIWAWNRWPQRRQPVLTAGVCLGLVCVTPLAPLNSHQFPQGKIVSPLASDQRCWLSLYSWRELQDPRPELVVPTRYANRCQIERIPMVNGYSPLYAAPVIRAWTFSNAGSLEPTSAYVANIAMSAEAGGLMDKLGVSGLLLSPDWQPLGPFLARNQWRLLGHEGLVQCWVRERAPQPVFESLDKALYTRWGAETAAAALKAGTPPVIRSARKDPGLYEFTRITCQNIRAWRNGCSCTVSANASDRPALLAIHRPWFQGYRAFLNSQELSLETLDLNHIAVEIPAGSPAGQLEIVYRPHAFDTGLLLGVVGVILALSLWRKSSSGPKSPQMRDKSGAPV